jgi:uncharacterized protein
MSKMLQKTLENNKQSKSFSTTRFQYETVISMSPKFQVYKDAAGKTRFRLRANNNQIIAVGEAYEQHSSCINGIKSIQRNCNAEIEDLTTDGKKIPNPKYQVFTDKKGEFRFHLKAKNGEIIAQGEGYKTKLSCIDGIKVVKNSCNAEIEDLTVNNVPLGVAEPKAEVPTMPENAVPKAEMPQAPEVTVKPPEVPTIVPSVVAEQRIEVLLSPDVTLKAAEVPIIVPPTVAESKVKIPQRVAVPRARMEQTTFSGPAETVLELLTPPSANKGERFFFEGRLFRSDSGTGIPDARIDIWEQDRSLLGDDYLAYGKTATDGSFSIPWKARSLTWRKNTANIYAIFRGNDKAKPTKSTTQTIAIK